MGFAGTALDDGYPPAPHFSVGSDAIARQEFRHVDLKTEFLTETDWKNAIDWPLHGAEPFKNALRHSKFINYVYKSEEDELSELIAYKGTEGDSIKSGRETRLHKIFAEANSYIGLFENIARFDISSHPNTANLLYAGERIAFDVVVYYKNRVGRIRPSVLRPELDPPIPVPAHASFPSGHATQAYLVYLLLEHVLYRVVEADGGVSRSTFYDKYENVLAIDPEAHGIRKIAENIGKNREYAGVHYESDTLAGQKLAEDLFHLIVLNSEQTQDGWEYFSDMFKELFDEAVAEWRRLIQTGYFG